MDDDGDNDQDNQLPDVLIDDIDLGGKDEDDDNANTARAGFWQ